MQTRGTNSIVIQLPRQSHWRSITKMATKDILDIWDAIRQIREDLKKLQDADRNINIEFLSRSYDSVVEKLELIQKDVDTLKSR